MNAGISTRMAAPLVVLSALLLTLGVGAAWYVNSMQRNSAEIVTNHMASVRAAYELKISIREFRRQLNRYLYDANEEHLALVPEIRQRADHWLNEAERMAYTPTEQEQIKRVRQAYKQFIAKYELLTSEMPALQAYQQFVARYEILTGEKPASWAYDRFHDEINALTENELLQQAEAYQKFNEASLDRMSEDNQELGNRVIAGLVGLGVCGASGGLLLGWLIASSVRRSIQQTQQQLRSTARELNRVTGTASSLSDSGEWALDVAVQSVSVSATAVLERLDRSERNALRAEQLAYVGQMAAGIAHEVRNPLMAMKILVQKAGERSAAAPFPSRDLQVLEDEIERVEEIITYFLEFARPPRIEKHVLDPGPLLERVTSNVAARAQQQQVRVQYIAPTEPIFVDVDVGQIQQVIYNLFINAFDAMPAGGKVSIELSREQKHPEMAPTAIVRVADNGTGLPLSLGERIFEPFISSKEAGLGLGLSICRRIVEAHGGELLGANRPDGGAVFTIRLPAVESPRFAPAH